MPKAKEEQPPEKEEHLKAELVGNQIMQKAKKEKKKRTKFKNIAAKTTRKTTNKPRSKNHQDAARSASSLSPRVLRPRNI